MAERVFPRTREDGSFTVAARFTLSQADAADLVSRQLGEWITQQNSTEHVDLLADLSSLPRIELVDPTTVDLIFEGRPGSQLWKGLLVDLTKQLTSRAPATLIGFWDLVAGRPHPASVGPPDITTAPQNEPTQGTAQHRDSST
jgi:hypothetical protein